MLTLSIEKYKSIALEFRDLYKQNILDAIKEKQIKLGKLYTLLDEHFIDKLFLYSPDQQYKLISIVLKRYPVLENRSSQEYKALKYIFIEQGYEKINKKDFYNKLGINSCIYCNRNYIFNLDANGHIKGQIDHFYDKASYPYLAISFYNLIPSCEGCNKVKSTYNTYQNKSINPYLREEHQLFDVRVKESGSFEYQLYDDDLLRKLLIEDIYNDGHTDILNDMYKKFYQEETKEHFALLKQEFQSLGISDDEIYRYLTCAYHNQDDFHKRTFSKLTKDIAKELQLL